MASVMKCSAHVDEGTTDIVQHATTGNGDLHWLEQRFSIIVNLN